MNPLISVIVPCYNQAQYLEECLQSVLDQTYQNWECIIVNDGSSDDTEEIANKWSKNDERIKYIYKENEGLSSARNLGVKISLGEFIYFIDSDDSLNGNGVFDLFISNLTENIDFICADLQEIFIDKTVTEHYFTLGYERNRILENENILEDFLLKKFPVIACNKLISKNILLKNSIFFKEGILHEDELFALDLCMNSNKVLVLKEITYNYNRKNATSITRESKNNIKAIDDKIIIINEYFKVAVAQNDYFKKIFFIKINRLANSIIENKMLLSNYKKWNFYYKKVLKIYIKYNNKKYFYKENKNKYVKFIILKISDFF